MNWLNTVKNGDVIETSTTYPFVNHFGIFIRIDDKPFVIHHTPKKGSVVDSFDSFFDDRQFIKIHKTKISGIEQNELIKRYLLGRKRYHLFFYDCEDFVGKITGEDIGFKQMESAAIFLGSAILLLLIFKKPK
jgi:hypothetical protein